MSIDDTGGHARESFRHGIQVGLVTNTSIHHLVVTFCPRNTLFVTPACPTKIENKTAMKGGVI